MRVLLALVGTLMMLVQSAEAQPSGECMQCRAMAHFRTCTRPLDGATVLQGTAARIVQERCSQVLVLDNPRAQGLKAPASIQVDLGPCALWAGELQTTIRVAVRETPSMDRSKYSLACQLFGTNG